MITKHLKFFTAKHKVYAVRLHHIIFVIQCVCLNRNHTESFYSILVQVLHISALEQCSNRSQYRENTYSRYSFIFEVDAVLQLSPLINDFMVISFVKVFVFGFLKYLKFFSAKHGT